MLVALTLLVFGRIVSHDFVWDDDYTILTNPRLNPASLRTVLYYLTHAEFGLYIPLTYTGWVLLAIISSLVGQAAQGSALHPGVFHACSLVVHLASALVVCSILTRLVSVRWAAMAGAFIFAIHPIQVEAVAWASGLKDLLCGFFVLLMLRQYLVAWDFNASRGANDLVSTGSEKPSHPARHLTLITLYFVCALLAKPAAVYAPLLIVVIHLWVIRRPLRPLVVPLLIWMSLAVGASLLGRHVQPAYEVWQPPVWSRPLLAFDAIAFYITKTVFPLSLGVDYGRSPQHVFTSGTFYLSTCVTGTILLGLFLLRKQRPNLSWGACLFVIPLTPVLGFLPFLYQQYSTVADHYAYVSMLGISVMVSMCLARTHVRAWRFLTTAGVMILAGGSFVQAGTWRDSRSLFTHAFSVNPRSFMAASNLAATTMGEASPVESEHWSRQAIAIKPDYAPAYELLAKALFQQGRRAEAVQAAEAAIARYQQMPVVTRPDLSTLHVAIARQYVEMNQPAEAVSHLRASLEVRDDPAIRKMLGEIHSATRPSRP